MKKHCPSVQFQRCLLAIGVLLALPTAVLAQDADDATELDEIIITGTRTEVPLEESLVPAQVIDREEIERSQARSITQLLQGRTGIGFSNQGGLGKITTLNIRGTESDHVLVLIDGVRVGSATAGLPALQDLPVDQIERIEIVRGPRSSLYGSEAIGGVIQIFTRRGEPGLRQHLRVGAGSNSMREASAGFGYGGTRGWIGADAAYQETDGINACRGAGFPIFRGCFTDEPDLDGYRNVSLSLRGGIDLTETLVAEGTFLDAHGDNEFDGSFTNRSETVQQVLGGKLRYTPSKRLKLELNVGRNRDKSDDYLDDTYLGRFGTVREQASLQGDFAISSAQLLTAGLDWQEDTVDSDTAYDQTRRDNQAVFVEYQGRSGAQQFQASLRSDDNEQFGEHTTGSLGHGYGFKGGLRFNTVYATGFKAPSFNDLYFPFFGNPELRPESSKSLNLGLSQYASRYSWTFNVYETHVDDLVTYDASIFLPNNIEKARLRGAEFTVDTTLAGWELSAQLSHTDPRNDTDGANFDNLLARRARNTGRIDVDRAFGDLRLGTTLTGASYRYDNAANTVRLAGYGTLDLRMEYALHPRWTLQARATNVLNRQYETISFYNQSGREYGVSLRYRSGL